MLMKAPEGVELEHSPPSAGGWSGNIEFPLHIISFDQKPSNIEPNVSDFVCVFEDSQGRFYRIKFGGPHTWAAKVRTMNLLEAQIAGRKEPHKFNSQLKMGLIFYLLCLGQKQLTFGEFVAQETIIGHDGAPTDSDIEYLKSEFHKANIEPVGPAPAYDFKEEAEKIGKAIANAFQIEQDKLLNSVKSGYDKDPPVGGSFLKAPVPTLGPKSDKQWKKKSIAELLNDLMKTEAPAYKLAEEVAAGTNSLMAPTSQQIKTLATKLVKQRANSKKKEAEALMAEAKALLAEAGEVEEQLEARPSQPEDGMDPNLRVIDLD